jgi:UDP-N-acetylmuramate dehydrogenase
MMLPKTLKNTKRNVDLAPYTYFGLKGKTAYLLETRYPEELKECVIEAKKAKIKHFIVAGGSNIVVQGGKYDGLVIVYREQDKELKPDSIERKGDRLTVWGSVPLWKIVKYSIENGLAGLESLSGIPGNLSGAVYGNAGAYGHSISEAVEKVLIFDGKQEKWLSKKECFFDYRESIFKKKSWVILSIQLKLKPGNRDKLREYSDSLIAQRNERYANIKCPGSFFKNVLVAKVSKSSLSKVDKTKIIDGKIPAGYLLETIGAKGMKIGGLLIADYHGNLIINDGKATYRDVEKLVKILKEKVKAKFGIKIEEEVKYLV